jgi:adenylate cyclase class IV
MSTEPRIFYEIELKAVLNRDKYQQLDKILKSDPKYKLINTETIKTDFYKADAERTDIRLRHSDKTVEIVYKKGLITKICRQEICIPLQSLEELDYFRLLFNDLPLEKQRRTIKHKQEFNYRFNGYDYIICLQYIEELAYILEVEYLGKSEAESKIHEPNLQAILAELDLSLLDGEKYLKRVEDYKKGINTLDYE